jgi:hypothetical protein
VLGAAGCDSPGDVLVAEIELEEELVASCIQLTVSEPPASAPGALLAETRVVRQPGQDGYRVAVYRQTLPVEVVLQAHALEGAGCAEPLTPVSSSEAMSRSFDPDRPRSAKLQIDAPVVPPAPPDTRVGFSSGPLTALMDACAGPVRIRPVDGAGNPISLATAQLVTLSASQPGVAFALDAQCAQRVTEVSLPVGMAEASFYFSSRTPGPVELLAVGPSLAAGSQVHQIVPTVRAGACRIAGNQATVSCPFSPPAFDMGKVFVVFQATSADATPDGAMVACTLANASTITCARHAGASPAAVDIAWQLVELARGIRVQRLTHVCNPGNVQTLPQAVDPAQAFILASARVGGGIVDFNDYRTVRLIGNNQVEVMMGDSCNGTNEVQVVELAGARVDRGTLGSASGLTATVTSLPAVDLGRSFLLYSWRFASTSSPLCGNALRGELTSPTEIAFSRGDGATSCGTSDVTTIAWERVELPAPARVQQVPITVPDGMLGASTSLQAVSLARSFAFTGGQWSVGQAYGETAWNNDDVPGVVSARHFLGAPDRLDLTRGASTGAARFTSFVVELP